MRTDLFLSLMIDITTLTRPNRLYAANRNCNRKTGISAPKTTSIVFILFRPSIPTSQPLLYLCAVRLCMCKHFSQTSTCLRICRHFLVVHKSVASDALIASVFEDSSPGYIRTCAWVTCSYSYSYIYSSVFDAFVLSFHSVSSFVINYNVRVTRESVILL
jgi:hypothetical protein